MSQTIVSQLVGVVPVDKGDYVPGTAYAERNQVHIYNSVLESKHDNNTTAPAEVVGGEVVFNTDHWTVVVDGSDQWLIDQGIKKVEASHVKDGSKTQQTINAETSGRITELEQSVGAGGSVDERIEEAKADIIGDASSNYNTLEKVQDRLTEEAAYRRAAENNRYTKAETYTKEEVNGLITTPSQEYKTYEATDQTTDITDILPSTGEADTIYRVGSWDGTQYDAGYYSEYAWSTTSSTYVFLKKDNVGIDEEPTPGSSKSVTSGGVAGVNGFHDYNKLQIIDALTDKKGRILSYRDIENILYEHHIHIAEGLLLGDTARQKFINEFCVLSNATTLVDNENNDIPESPLIKRAIERSNAITNIKWTPLLDMPKRRGGVYAANVEVTGVPYSATYQEDKCVGIDVSMETFMTAVNNPYSLIYTEVTDIDNAESIWGKTYRGISEYAGCYYGNVCAEHVDACLGFIGKYLTSYFPIMNKNQSVGSVVPMRYQTVKVGDILYQEGHVALVVKITRNTLGEIQNIVVADQADNYAHLTSYSPEEFNNRVINRTTPAIYRNISKAKDSIFASLEFNPSTYTYNNDICTFAGDKACFNEGELIVINYNLKNTNSGWTAIELYKNDILLETYNIADIDQSELPEGQRNHALKLANGLEYGDYKARLVSGGNTSDFTTFKVVRSEVSFTKPTPDAAIVTFRSENSIPVYIGINSAWSGITYGIYELTPEDISNGYAFINAEYFVTQKLSNKVTSGSNYALKVFFATEFGRVVNKENTISFTF